MWVNALKLQKFVFPISRERYANNVVSLRERVTVMPDNMLNSKRIYFILWKTLLFIWNVSSWILNFYGHLPLSFVSLWTMIQNNCRSYIELAVFARGFQINNERLISIHCVQNHKKKFRTTWAMLIENQSSFVVIIWGTEILLKIEIEKKRKISKE